MTCHSAGLPICEALPRRDGHRFAWACAASHTEYQTAGVRLVGIAETVLRFSSSTVYFDVRSSLGNVPFSVSASVD